jgi:hypothetical protein
MAIWHVEGHFHYIVEAENEDEAIEAPMPDDTMYGVSNVWCEYGDDDDE